jgi:hypothetical protein
MWSRIALVVILILLFATTLTGYYSAGNNLGHIKEKSRICIAAFNTRYTDIDLEITRSKDYQQLRDIDVSKMNSTSLYLYINKMYALKHQYRLMISNGSEDQDFMTKYPMRHHSWLKLNFIVDIQETQTDCEWIAVISPLVFFAMDKHHVPLETFFERTNVHDSSFTFPVYQRERSRNGGVYRLDRHVDSFKIGLSGVYLHPKKGYPAPSFSGKHSYTSPKVFFIRNNSDGKRMMQDWLHGPKHMSDSITQVYNFYSQKSSWEQSVLEKVIIPLHSSSVSLYSYKDMLGTCINIVGSTSIENRKLQLIEKIKQLQALK